MKSLSILSLLLCLLFFNCEDGLSCIIPKEPELPSKSFPVASTERYYYTDLRAEINNEPRDDDYDYYFDVEGLPLGIDYFVNFRTISIEGTPQITGTFEITIYLDVDGPFNDYDDETNVLCSYNTQKTYTLIVE